jgi:predicted DNA-binding protein (MmcQ/YjbR family)
MDRPRDSSPNAVLTYCLAKPGAEETYPWGDGEMVAKAGGKGFAFVGLGKPGSVAVKATPEEGAAWRDRYPETITASAYIGRFGWISVTLDGTVPADELAELIDDSYRLIVAKLPKSRRPAGWDA